MWRQLFRFLNEHTSWNLKRGRTKWQARVLYWQRGTRSTLCATVAQKQWQLILVAQIIAHRHMYPKSHTIAQEHRFYSLEWYEQHNGISAEWQPQRQTITRWRLRCVTHIRQTNRISKTSVEHVFVVCAHDWCMARRWDQCWVTATTWNDS